MRLQTIPFSGHELQRRNFAGFAVFESLYRPNQDIPKHSHEQTYVSIVLRGSYTERIGPSDWECETGQTILHTAGESHSDRFHKVGGQVLNLELFPPFLARLGESGEVSVNSRRTLFRSSYAMQLGLRLHSEVSNCDPSSSLAIEGLTMELLAEIFRQHEKRPSRRDCDWLSKIAETLHEKFAEPVTLSELAACVSVHPVHLARAFRKRYLCSVGEYLRKLRIEAACRALLNSEAPLVDIALRSGFSDQSHLCRTLKQYTGMSPRHFRQVRFRS